MRVSFIVLFAAGLISSLHGRADESSSTPASPEGSEPKSVEESKYVDRLPKEKKEGVFVIKTGVGSGTGFLGRMQGKTFLVTNLHVLFGAKEISAMNQSGLQLKTGKIYGAADHDIAIIEVKNPVPETAVFDIEMNVPEGVLVNDSVLIPGNSLGASTLLQTQGKVAGLGPRIIEHTAPIYQGNSGSPIVGEKNGRVVAVMAYARKVDSAGECVADSASNPDTQIKKAIRYFGFRFDTVKSWYPIDFKLWQQQCAFLMEKQKRMIAVAAFYYNRPDWTADPEILSRFNSCEARLSKLKAPLARRNEATNFLQFLRSRMEADTNALIHFERTAYPFLSDAEANVGESSARWKVFGQKMETNIKSHNEEIVARVATPRLSVAK